MSADFDTAPIGSPLRAVVVGAGAMGVSWLRAIQQHPDLTLSGIVDTDVRRAKGAAIRLRCPDVPVADSLVGLPDVTADVCVNVTPPDCHFDVSAQALRQGLSVLSEKPFAGSLEQAVELVDIARSQRRLLMVSQSRRYEPGLARLRTLTEGLGALGLVTTEFRVAYRVDGFRAVMEHPLLLDMAVHSFDAVRYLTSARPVAVYCDEFNPKGSWYRGAAAATAVVEMSNDIRYVYVGSWCYDGLPTSWSGQWRISGERGTAAWDGVGRPVVEFGPDDGGPQVGGGGADSVADDPVGQVRRPLDDFVNALRTGAPAWGEGADNLLTLAMTQAAIASARTRSLVLVDDLLAEARRTVSRCG